MVQQRASLLVVGLAYLSFVSIGLPDGLLGAAWPSIRLAFQLPLDALGSLLVMFTSGYLASSFCSGRVLARMNVGVLLALSCLITATSLLGYALAPQWTVMVVLGFVSGLGAGAIDAGMNTFAATHFSARSVNWLHACYGVGATVGPVIMTSLLIADRSWRWGYAIVGISQLLLAVCFGLTHTQWPNASSRQQSTASAPPYMASSASTLKLPTVWLSIAVFFVYTGLEAAAGVWSYSLFSEARAIPARTAGMWLSAYWGSLTLGRVVAGFFAIGVPVRRLLRCCMIGIVFGAALIWFNLDSLLNGLGLALMGLSAAPVFPSLIAATPGRLGVAHTANGVGFQIAAAVLGQSLLPSLIGVLANQVSLETIGPALLSAATLLFLLHEVLVVTSLRHARKAHSHAVSVRGQLAP